jgi:DNA uptake protein ComE-like DNA-binding protein
VKTYFDFSKKERIGVLLLCSLLLVLIFIFNVESQQFLPSGLEVDPADIEYIQLSSATEKKIGDDAGDKTIADKDNWSLFDPNDLDKQGWTELGFSEKQALSILNYKNNYGPFKKKSDIKKLYVVSDEKFNELEPFIQFKQEVIEDRDAAQSAAIIEIKENKVLINQATQEELIALPHIGPVYAERIMKFRDKLGGFVTTAQYDDLYISDEAKKSLNIFASLDTNNVRKVDINNASKQELKHIPGSSWELVAMILKEREKSTLEHLNWLPENIISDEDLEIFIKYINF